MPEEFSMPAAMSRMTSEAITLYLKSRGWTERACRYQDRVYLEGAVHAAGEPYQLYLPASQNVPKYRTLLQRAIYKLSGIEDREPPEIIADIFAHTDREAMSASATRQCIRVRNSGQTQMRIRVSSRSDEYRLMPDESVELICEVSKDNAIEVEHTGESIVIWDHRSSR